jgi:hypothetical protein
LKAQFSYVTLSTSGTSWGTKVAEDRGSQIETVNLDSRYQMAWIEVTTRITQRQNALYLFIAISGAIIGYFSTEAFRREAATDPIFWVHKIGLLGVPVTAWAFGRLNAKHDETIALLRRFLALCEQEGEAKIRGSALARLSYNANPMFAVYAQRFRQYHTHAFSAAIWLISSVGLALAFIQFFNIKKADYGLWAMFVLYALVYAGATFRADAIVKSKPQFEDPSLWSDWRGPSDLPPE